MIHSYYDTCIDVSLQLHTFHIISLCVIIHIIHQREVDTIEYDVMMTNRLG